MDFGSLVSRLTRVPNVAAVALGGSRASGRAREDSDWDLGLYYRSSIDAEAIRALGYEGYVSEPGEWGRLVNGGAWLTVDEGRVDVLYRDLDAVEHWTSEAENGRYEVSNEGGYLCGMPTYAYAGELAVGEVLHGELPRPAFPEALSQSAPPRWRRDVSFSLRYAEGLAARGDVVPCLGLLARAAIGEAHARLAGRGEWALNEKDIVRRAGLVAADEVLTCPGGRPRALEQAVNRMRIALGL